MVPLVRGMQQSSCGCGLGRRELVQEVGYKKMRKIATFLEVDILVSSKVCLSLVPLTAGNTMCPRKHIWAQQTYDTLPEHFSTIQQFVGEKVGQETKGRVSRVVFTIGEVTFPKDLQ